MSRRSPEEIRTDLVARLRTRWREIEQVVLARVYAISGDAGASDSDYLVGLRTTVEAALDYGLALIERGEQPLPAVPVALLAQARIAAHSGVGLDTVLRRYVVGYSLLSGFVIQEAERGSLLVGPDLQRVLQDLAAGLDRVIAAVTEELSRELQASSGGSRERRRAQYVERILAGELLDVSDLGYNLDASHIGFVAAAGAGVVQALHRLAAALARRLLLIPSESGVVWGWLGGDRALPSALVLERSSEQCVGPFAIGEPGSGIAGWRVTHAQAKAAYTVARRRGRSSVRYADVALLASTLRDDLLVNSLRELYLDPLARERDGGVTLRKTLRAWFEADRNLSSAAAALGVNRRTVANRLHTVDERLGRPLARETATHMEVALWLEELAAMSTSTSAPAAVGRLAHHG